MDPAILKLFFTAAANFPHTDERRMFLDRACQGDPELRRQLDELLEGVPAAESFFEFQPEVQPERKDGAAGEEGLGTTIGRYRLIERIGAGGCGVVYLAEQQEPVRRKVALKIIRPGMDTESVIARFGAVMPTSRILANSPGAHGVFGVTTGLVPSLTLGCGTFGGNSTTDNVTFTNLRNVKRLARLVEPAGGGTDQSGAGDADRPG